MKKSQFIDLVAERAEMSKAAAARVVDAIFDTAGGAISEAVRTAGSLSIPGFGKFSSKTRAAREGRNPRTGTVIQIPERTTVSFSPGKGFKDTMSGSGGSAAGGAGGAGATAKSRTAGSARKAAGGAAKTASAPAAGGAAATKSATKKSSAPAKSAGGGSAAAKSAGAASKGATKGATKTGGTKSAKK
jgi:DNA-binding protein HU-beta